MPDRAGKADRVPTRDENWEQFLERTDYEKCERPRAARFDLDGIRELLNKLGNPQDKYKSFHIAGSKGKGSVAHFIERGLRARGELTGLYTSPHITSWGERISVNGQEVPHRLLAAAMTRVLMHSTKGLTFFDLITATAFCVYEMMGCTTVVIETGLGGRSDSTNVLSHPSACIVTSIELEHTDVLGDDLLQIAAEKAGIFKKDAAIWSGVSLLHPAQSVLTNAAEQVGQTLRKIRVRPRSSDFPYPQEHMWTNYTLAMDVVKNYYHDRSESDALLPEPFSLAADQFGIPGHYEGRQLEDGRTVVFDTAHSIESLRAVIEAFHNDYPFMSRGVVFALRDDKNFSVMADSLRDLIHADGCGSTRWFATRAGEHPRSADPADLAQAFGAKELDCVGFPDGPDVLLVTGSTYLVGALRPQTSALAQPF
ncbi:MAG: hypothetical protein HN405_05660 [Planctomycetes bacterium]|jgi:dihydrofolate synthase / folylpolyglutamate synthase|nr:hypothetical protein [Planctomycetota bacterium]MBT4029874.1 hypothetical protein [Planctomycetota bacterium]MBT7011698.1 hypothetical protein [Planctomycetota bacterium]MBT7317945.1 hypothetical protein [Planctomycetota bacterium]